MAIENQHEQTDPRESALVEELIQSGYRRGLAQRVAEARLASTRHVENKRGRKDLRRRGGQGMA